MLGQRRKVYIVSDLHLGGAAPTSPGERGFQICTQTAQLAEFIDHLDEAGLVHGYAQLDGVLPGADAALGRLLEAVRVGGEWGAGVVR